jgi:hypothetical protein
MSLSVTVPSIAAPEDAMPETAGAVGGLPWPPLSELLLELSEQPAKASMIKTAATNRKPPRFLIYSSLMHFLAVWIGHNG